jgi:hypothetical protein
MIALGLIAGLISVDRTWTIDETAITVRHRYVVGQRIFSWPLDRVTSVRVHDVKDSEGDMHYCVEIQLAGRWKTVRCYVASTQAWAFRNLIEGVLTARDGG